MTINKITCGTSTGSELSGSINELVDSGRFLVNNTQLNAEAGISVTLTSGIVTQLLPKTWNRVSEFFSNLGGTIIPAGPSFPDDRLITSDGTVDYGSGGAIKPIYVKSFYFYGDKFELHYKETGGQIDVLINNGMVGGFTAPITGQLRYMEIDLGSTMFVRVDILCTNALTGDVYTASDHNIHHSNSSKKVVIAGDSFTEGTGAPFGLGYAEYMRYLTGNYDIVNSGSGGTGYLQDNAGRPNLEDRVQTDIVDQAPDVVIIAMGINDTASGALTTSIQNTFNTIKTGLPDARVIILGSWTSGEATANMQSITTTIETEAASKGFTFINPTGTGNDDGWITGTGDVSSPVGDGNADIFVSSDGTHPSELGHHYLASRLLQELFNVDIVV